MKFHLVVLRNSDSTSCCHSTSCLCLGLNITNVLKSPQKGYSRVVVYLWSGSEIICAYHSLHNISNAADQTFLKMTEKQEVLSTWCVFLLVSFLFPWNMCNNSSIVNVSDTIQTSYTVQTCLLWGSLLIFCPCLWITVFSHCEHGSNKMGSHFLKHWSVMLPLVKNSTSYL